MWNGKTLAVVLPTYNEKDSIAETIRAFEQLGIVDDILVVNNNAAEGTSDEVVQTTAREVLEPRQGYGAAILRGLAEVDSDLICICEPDGTFNPKDLTKLLPFTEDCSLVLGSRTVSNFIWDGANMGWFLQWGNWAVAKTIEVLFNTSYLSDVGCTFRVVSKELVPGLRRDSRIHGSAFGLEMLMLALVARDTVVQVTGRHLGSHRRHPYRDSPRPADARDSDAHAHPTAAPPTSTDGPPQSGPGCAAPVALEPDGSNGSKRARSPGRGCRELTPFRLTAGSRPRQVSALKVSGAA
jgi:glycosyltransferase involved in cell wall biosynthesis